MHRTQQEEQMTTTKRITRVLTVALVAMGIVGLTVGSASAASITIVNGGFEDPLDPSGWYEVPDWDEGGASYYGSGSGGFLYLEPGGWVDQDLDYNWTAGEVFTLGISGEKGWQASGAYKFKVQLRQADTTVLWDSGELDVTGTVSNFSWTINSSTDFLAGTSGSQLNIRLEGLVQSVYLDDVTLSTSLADTNAPTLASSDIVDDKSGGPVNPGERVTYTVTFSENMDSGTVSTSDFENAGSAATVFGAVTSLAANRYRIPLVPASTGTLELRVPVGATFTDLSGNSLDTGSAIFDDTTINVVAPGDVMGIFNR
jgi:hypothetical protein